MNQPSPSTAASTAGPPDTAMPAEIDGMAAFPIPPAIYDDLDYTWTVMLREKFDPGGSRYRVCRVRRADTPGTWEVTDEAPGAQGLPWALAAMWFARAVQAEAAVPPDPLQEDRHLPR